MMFRTTPKMKRTTVCLLLGLMILCFSTVVVGQPRVISVRYGYFTEARPFHAACARGWLDLALNDEVYYQVTCYPQESGNFAAARLDNLQLDLAHLGSTPWAQAAARGVDAKVVYLSSYMGTSQGIYVRGTTAIKNPYDLEGKRVAVPFGSTMHYHVLFLLDLLGLVGSVEVVNMSPTEIIAAWNADKIDVAGCWGSAKEHVLQNDGRTLLSAGVLADWGRPTFTSLAVSRTFLREHQEFVTYFVGILSRLTDSFIDRLGQFDSNNLLRWEVENGIDTSANSNSNSRSLVFSLTDANMRRYPSYPPKSLTYANRQALNTFVDVSSKNQLECSYLGQNCDNVSDSRIAITRTADFLVQQKVLNDFGDIDCLNDLACAQEMMDGSILASARQRICRNCLLVGPYANITSALDNDVTGKGQDPLLSLLEEWDVKEEKNNTYIARGNEPEERRCDQRNITFTNSSGAFGDGANAAAGRSYADEQYCQWKIAPYTSTVSIDIEVSFQRLRLWSGDFIRIYGSANGIDCPIPDSDNAVFLGQFTGFWDESNLPPPVYGTGCIVVIFETDANAERTYGESQTGDGFWLEYAEVRGGCTKNSYTYPRICSCRPFEKGAFCEQDEELCFGTSRLELSFSTQDKIANSYSHYMNSDDLLNSDSVLDPSALDPLDAYPNDLSCRFEIKLPSKGYILVSIYYDLEPAFDFLYLQRGPATTTVKDADESIYAVLTGTHAASPNQPTDISQPEIYYLPTDDDGFATIRLETDSMGRRRGFYADLEAYDDVPTYLCNSYDFCEPSHCLAQNTMGTSLLLPNDRYSVGRVVSHTAESSLPKMPWALDGGCVWPWPSESSYLTADIVGLRLIFNIPLDLEAYPSTSVGDKVIVRLSQGEDDVELFLEQCDSDEACSFPWQTGVCNVTNGACTVASAVQIDVNNQQSLESASIRLVTDRNDQGRYYEGLDFDVLLVKQCPAGNAQAHCENVDGASCVDGFCFCADGRACSCPCDGEPSVISSGASAGKVIGILIPFLLLLLAAFLWYRHKKIQQSRGQKAVIEEKEAELEAFRDSVVGMRTAIKKYIPTATVIESSSAFLVPIPPPREEKAVPIAPPSQVRWCWKETNSRMHVHDNSTIWGSPTDCWIKYDDVSNARLESAYQKSQSGGCDLPSGYSVNFLSMMQTKHSTGFQREVIRNVVTPPQQQQQSKQQDVKLDVADVDQVGKELPEELRDDPQMVLVTGDVVQIAKQRPDGWAFGTKLQHADEAVSRQLVKVAIENSGGMVDDALILTDTGWFELESTRIPSGDDLEALKSKVGDTGALSPPETWEEVKDPTVVKRYPLSKDSLERKEVVQAFMTTLSESSFKILNVERVQNLAMWQSYVVKRQTICSRETGRTDLAASEEDTRRAIARIERHWLWHATNVEVIEKILQQGFNRSFCGKNATMYGKGVYFARDASYSANTTYAVPDAQGTQYMLACRVVVGEYCVGRKDALTPDVRDHDNNILYDSTVAVNHGDTMASPSIYVTYHDAQAYPAYVISFKTL